MLLNWLFRKPAQITKEHWSRPDSYPESWAERAELAAKFIAPGSSVLDIGCGRMQLRALLPAGCAYTPADMTKWTDEVHQIDLDRREFPPGRYDLVTFLGVLEYLQDPAFAMERAADTCKRLITTYCHPVSATSIAQRRKAGWINDLSEAELKTLLKRTGWSVTHADLFQQSKKFSQMFYVAERS